MKTYHFSLLVIDGVFVTAIAALSKLHPVHMELGEVALLALATFRMARTISFNEVASPIRAPFTEVLPDSCGAGSDVHPKGKGVRLAIGGLLSCPICTGTWSALILFSLWNFVPSFGHILVYVLALAGISEFIHYLSCLTEWGGRLARVTSGKLSPDKE